MSVNTVDEACLDFGALDTIFESMPGAGQAQLIPLLQEIQRAYGYLPKPILAEMSRRTGIEAARIYGVATFYEQFYLEPRGRHTVKCCCGTACHVKGGTGIAEAISSVLGVEPGGTTEDMCFTFETVACLGTCFLAPVIMVNNDYYGNLSARKIKKILEKYT